MFRCSSVVSLLLSTDALHTGLCFFVWCNKPLQTNPLHSDRWHVSVGDVTERLLSTSIACHWAIIIKGILLSFGVKCLHCLRLLFLQATRIAYSLLLATSCSGVNPVWEAQHSNRQRMIATRNVSLREAFRSSRVSSSEVAQNWKLLWSRTGRNISQLQNVPLQNVKTN